tara:strand:- start:2318 stop:3001 length:684 start_codon:yes stop_codon:yes gene_type:complete
MNKSETLAALGEAMTKAQAEMSGAKKTAKNPFFKSNYANLEEVIYCIKEPFANNGLSFLQFPITEDGFAGVETVLMHKSGEWMSGEFMLKCSKNDPQGMGSAITYARRYGLQSIAGVPSEDDDGNAATQPSPRSLAPAVKAAQAKAKASKPTGKPVFDEPQMTKDQEKNINALYKTAKLTPTRLQNGVYRATNSRTQNAQELTKAEAATLISLISGIIESDKNEKKA